MTGSPSPGSLDSKRLDAVAERGLAYQAMGQDALARVDYTTVIEAGAGDYYSGFAYFHRGEITGDERDFRTAIDRFDFEINGNPKNADAWLLRGVSKRELYRLTGDIGLLLESMDDIWEATRLVPEYRDAWNELAVTRDWLGFKILK